MYTDGIQAPSGPDELFRQYYSYIRKIVSQTPAIPAQEAEDVAMEIVTRFLERDVVGMFDPEKRFSYNGREVPAKFRTFLVSQVQTYAKGHRDRLGRQRKRETAVPDTPLQDGGLSLLDLFGSTEDDLSYLDAAEWIRQARSFLATVPKRSDHDRCDLVLLFDELARQALTGQVEVRQVAVRLGISPALVRRWMAWLRQNMSQQAVLSRRVTVDGEPYTVYHVQQAVQLLKEVKGAPHVKGPLVRGSNPLWRMDYHKVSRYEQATYPECKVPSLNQGKGHYAPHVLTAVVHHLERAVAAVP